MLLLNFIYAIESGLIIGYPTAITLTIERKLYYIDLYAGGPDVMINSDYQKNIIKKIENTPIGVDAGIGTWVRFKSPMSVGVRIPFEFFYPLKELKLYLELAPGFKIVEKFTFEFQGGIGVRFKL
ncbi:MAG: hypothetical protein NZ870_03905 [bacterium]|nr:hypothetical protein [bacterium]